MRVTSTIFPALLLASLAIALCLTLATGRQTEAGVFSLGIGSAIVPPGANATVALTANAVADDGTANGGPGDGIGFWSVDVAFDTPNLTYVSCTAHISGVCINPVPGVVQFTGTNFDGLTGALELGTVTFAAGPTLGAHLLDATIVILADPQAIDIQGVAATDGEILIQQPTPSPTATPQPTLSPSPTPPPPTPSPTAAPTPPLRKWGDVNCDGVVTAVDTLAILRKVAGLPVYQVAPCPTIGAVYP